MAIDDPLDAIRQQLESPQSERSPLTDTVLDIGLALASELVPLGGLVQTILQKHRQENVATAVLFLVQELKRLKTYLQDVDERHKVFLREGFIPLVIDGVEKAERVHSNERIKRIAKILANAAAIGPDQASDDTEELMRVAMELTDIDVLILRGVRQAVSATDRRPALERLEFVGLSSETIRSVLYKLQGYGLIAFFPEHFVTTGGGESLRLLPKGLLFISAVGSGKI